MNHKNFRYKSTQYKPNNDCQQLNNVDMLNPNYNQYMISQSSQKSSKKNLNNFNHANNIHPGKSRSKHQSFKPSMKSQEEHSDDYKMYQVSVSQHGKKYNPSRIKNENTCSIKSYQNYNQLQIRYKNIQNLLHQENHNLKQQNRLLLQQLRKSNKKQKKYKQLYSKTNSQLIITLQDRDYHRQQYRQLKDIVQNQMQKFQQKLYTMTMKTIGSQKFEQGQILTNDFHNFKRKISMGKLDSDISDNTNSETLE